MMFLGVFGDFSAFLVFLEFLFGDWRCFCAYL